MISREEYNVWLNCPGTALLVDFLKHSATIRSESLRDNHGAAMEAQRVNTLQALRQFIVNGTWLNLEEGNTDGPGNLRNEPPGITPRLDDTITLPVD